MNSTDIQRLVNEAKARLARGAAGFIVIGYDQDEQSASGHRLLGEFTYYEDALELAGSPAAGTAAHILHDEDLVYGLVSILLGEIHSLRARRGGELYPERLLAKS